MRFYGLHPTRYTGENLALPGSLLVSLVFAIYFMAGFEGLLLGRSELHIYTQQCKVE